MSHTVNTARVSGVLQKPVIKTLLLTDFVGSTHFIEQMGDARSAELFAQLDHAAREMLERYHGQEIDKTDGFLFIFDRPIDAIHYALTYHKTLNGLVERANLPGGVTLAARAGVHLGEVILRENDADHVARGAKPVELEGLAKPTVARISSLAQANQTLMTQSTFELARRASVGDGETPEDTQWLEHGAYLLKGIDEPINVYEVGVTGIAPLLPPPNNEKARRVAWATREAEEAAGNGRVSVALAVLAVLLLLGGGLAVYALMGNTETKPLSGVEKAATPDTNPADKSAVVKEPSAPSEAENGGDGAVGEKRAGEEPPVEEPAASNIVLTVNSAPSGAEIFHAGKLIGVAPLIVQVSSDAGVYPIRASLKGHTPTDIDCVVSTTGTPAPCVVRLSPEAEERATKVVGANPRRGSKAGAGTKSPKEKPSDGAAKKPVEKPAEKPKIHMID